MNESYNLIKFKYEHCVYTLFDLIEFVEKGYITEEEFHFITSFSYQGVKNKKRG